MVPVFLANDERVLMLTVSRRSARLKFLLMTLRKKRAKMLAFRPLLAPSQLEIWSRAR